MAVSDPKYPVKVPVTFAGINGATLLALMFNIFLYGVALLMVLQYFKRDAKRDLMTVKMTVVVLSILATLETAFACHQIYDLFITKRADGALSNIIVSSVPGKYMCAYITAFVAQLFFACCIWIVGRNLGSRLRYYAGLAILLALLQISAGLAQSIVMATSKLYSTMTMRTGLLVETTAIQGAAAALCDITISTTFCYLFRSQKSGIPKTDSMINKVMIYAINRAILTSFLAVSGVILYYFCSGTYYFQIPLFANTHIYVISVVGILTSGEGGLRERQEETLPVAELGMNTTAANRSQSDITDNEKAESVRV